jgi:AraC-like DNA-binding protein
LRWHRWLLAAYWGIILCYVAYRLLSFLEGPFPAWKYLIALGLTVFIYGLAWLGYLHPRLLAGLPLSEAVKPEKYRRSSLRPERSEALFSGVEALMREEGWYKNSGLSLDDLARRLQAGRHHVSQAINGQSGKTYAEYVNDYRIREAKRLLASTSKREMNVIEVAFQSGFSTKKAFNLAFRKATGRTPTLFREEARKTE